MQLFASLPLVKLDGVFYQPQQNPQLFKLCSFWLLVIHEVKVEATVPAILRSTVNNLKAVIVGENYELTIMYPEFNDVIEKKDYQR